MVLPVTSIAVGTSNGLPVGRTRCKQPSACAAVCQPLSPQTYRCPSVWKRPRQTPERNDTPSDATPPCTVGPEGELAGSAFDPLLPPSGNSWRSSTNALHRP